MFEESIEELEYLKENLINEVVDSIYYSITARSLKYRTEVKLFIFYFLSLKKIFNIVYFMSKLL